MKEKLVESEDLKNIRLFQDLTQPRSKCLSLVKSDVGINTAWTKEGTIFYKWKDKLAINFFVDFSKAELGSATAWKMLNVVFKSLINSNKIEYHRKNICLQIVSTF